MLEVSMHEQQHGCKEGGLSFRSPAQDMSPQAGGAELQQRLHASRPYMSMHLPSSKHAAEQVAIGCALLCPKQALSCTDVQLKVSSPAIACLLQLAQRCTCVRLKIHMFIACTCMRLLAG